MEFSNMKRWLLVAVTTVITAVWTSGAQAATPASWKDTGFSIHANGMMLREVLNEFGQVYGVRVAYDLPEERSVKGRLKADSGAEFLDRLTQPYKFRWFVYNDTLYIVPRDDNASVRLQVGEDAVQDAKAALMGVGLFDSRFGWGELPDEGIVIVSGPRAYVNLARDILLPDEKKAALKDKQIMVFRLKYASATDRVISTRGQTETIPGLKTILSRLVESGGPDKGSNGLSRFDAASEKRSRAGKVGKGAAHETSDSAGSASNARLQRNSEDNEVSDRGSKSKSSSSHAERPRIEADPALNAIIIYDVGSKRNMYKELIAELDVEPQQIEIEALIVDIDRSKLSEMGIEWGLTRSNGNTSTTVNGMRTESKGTELPLPGATLLISNAARFYARLKALEGAGEASVLAKPTVLTLENVAAVLDLSQTSYVPLVGERVADLTSITAGTMLRVVPRIVREGAKTRVRLEVDIEDGSLGNINPQTNVTRSTISTQAIVDMQQTLMIGGYHSESIARNNQKVPVLGDVPVFGNLFRSNEHTHSTRERLFLITPRVAQLTGMAATPTSNVAEMGRRVIKIDQQAFAEKVKRYGENLLLGEDNWPKAATGNSKSSSQPAAAMQESTEQTPAPSNETGTPVSEEKISTKKGQSSGQQEAFAKKNGSINASPMSLKLSGSIEGTVPEPPRKLNCPRPKGMELLPVG